tara:strand:+ start:3025 stop:3375 length:351 start_codon:yes stop_codon:yes gene_type:complete
MESGCVFCKIVSGEIKADMVFDSENFIVIKDANPQTPGHSLVIPKKHCDTFLDLSEEYYKEFLLTTKSVINNLMKEDGVEGFNLISNNYKIAGQIVPHLHLHIIPRRKKDGYSVGS